MTKQKSVVECGSRLDPNKPSLHWLETIDLTASAYLGLDSKRPGAELLAAARSYVKYCQQDIRGGNARSAAFNALAALQAVWCAEIKEGRSMIDLGVTLTRKAERHRASESAAATERRAGLQRKADAIWRQHPEWGASHVARKIDQGKANYIRRLIRKPSPK